MFQLASEELGRKSPLREKSGLHPAEDVGIGSELSVPVETYTQNVHVLKCICTSCQAQQTAVSPSLSLLWLPGRPFRFPLSQVRLGCAEHQSIQTLWRWQQHSCLLIFPVSGSPAMDWNLPWIWMDAKILYPFLSCCLSEQRKERHLHRGSHGGGTVPSLLLFSWGTGTVPGILTPKGGWLYEPVAALHPVQTGN